MLVGNYKLGALEGAGQVIFENGEGLEVNFHQGTIHGLVRKTDIRGNVVWVSEYHHGESRGGRAWQFLTGGGIITGNLGLSIQERRFTQKWNFVFSSLILSVEYGL